MLQTIEVEIDATGHIAPLEVLPMLPAGRALLTLLPATEAVPTVEHSTTVGASELPELGILFGVLKAQVSATGDDIKAAIRRRAASRFYDRD